MAQIPVRTDANQNRQQQIGLPLTFSGPEQEYKWGFLYQMFKYLKVKKIKLKNQ